MIQKILLLHISILAFFLSLPLLHAAQELDNNSLKAPQEKSAEALPKQLQLEATQIKNKGRDNPLHLACLSGDINMTTQLLDECKININEKGRYQRTPFLCAAEKGHLAIAKLLRQRGANLNVKDAYQDNALHLACLYSDSIPMVTWLLDVCNLGLESKGQSQRTPFLCATERGQLAIAKLLKQRGANLNAKDKSENNALHLACAFSGSKAMITWLLDICKIGLETKRQNQRTPFLCAVERGQLTIAKLLKQRGANINATSKSGNNALHLASLFSGSEAMVTWLLDVCNLESKGFNHSTPFLSAAQEGHLEIAKLLRQRGGNVNAKDNSGNNALHLACLFSGSEAMVTWLLDVCKIGIETEGFNHSKPFLFAAQEGHLNIANLLKNRGANIHAKDNDKNNALHLACIYSGSEAMVTWLLDTCKIGIETEGFKQRTPFLSAAQEGHLNIAQLLKKRGGNVMAKDSHKNNALHLACLFSGSTAMVTWLLNVCDIKIEAKGRWDKRTPFLCAAQEGHLNIVNLLKEQGADVNATDKDGNNALHFACLFSGSLAIVTWLLDTCKIGVETKGQYQRTPFLCAAQEGHLEIAKLLKQRGANINAKDKSGNNALHLACLFSGSETMVTWLLDECKIDIESKGQYQMTPFLCAAKGGHFQILKLLKQRGANINAKDEVWKNALHLACKSSNNVAMINWLLDVCKIGIESKEQDQRTPFFCAVQGGQLQIVKLLRTRQMPDSLKNRNNKKRFRKAIKNDHVKDVYGNSPLHVACMYSNSIPMFNFLSTVYEIDKEAKGENKKTLFLCAAQGGHIRIAKKLKDIGANIYAKDEHGNNALHLTCEYSGSIAMGNWLLDKCEIGLESKGQNNITPFLCAAKRGHLQMAKLLKKRGANLNAKDEKGNNALHLACAFSGSTAMVTWLLDICKIWIETKGCNEKTPLLCALEEGQLEMVKLLQNQKANMDAKDSDGKDALYYAQKSNNSKLIHFIKNK